MKTILKTTYMIIGGAIALTSCQGEQTPSGIPDDADRRIVFRSSFPELTTKAKEIATDLEYLQMTVFDENDDKLPNYLYAKDVRLEKNETTSRYSSDDCLWPEPGKETDLLHFFAYYPALPNKSELVNISENSVVGLKIKDYAIAANIADQVDFVTAYTTGNMAANLFSGINLNFRHQLCRVEVWAKGEHKSCDVEIAGICIANAVMGGTYEFSKSDAGKSDAGNESDADGKWSDTTLGDCDYIFRGNDKVVKMGADPQSIMGSKLDEATENCAMLIPANSTAWNYTSDRINSDKGLYLNVLLRIIDKTETAGKGQQKYPYTDNSEGLNAMDIPRVYCAVNGSGNITDKPGQLYKSEDGKYYTDAAKTTEYNAPDGSPVKEFGWAAIPISGDWEPGKIYTYTIDYTYGVGVHGPSLGTTNTENHLKAGDPIISDRVGVSMSVKGWDTGGSSSITVPGN